MDDSCPELRQSRQSLLRAWRVMQDLPADAFSDEPVRLPGVRSFAEEGQILCETLIRVLSELNRDLQGLKRALDAVKPYLGNSTTDVVSHTFSHTSE
jgi:hypothetical protein